MKHPAYEVDPLTRCPVGLPTDPAAAAAPAGIHIRGDYASLEPLDPALHADALWREVGGVERARLWRYLFDGPFADRDTFESFLRDRATDPAAVFFTILAGEERRPQGWASLMRIEPKHRVVEVGYVLLGPSLQRTRAATEAMYLLMAHVFDDLAYRRYEWKCDALNQASRDAALRLGFTYEGVFRQHMVVKGRNRDTAWFAITDGEWPQRKARLQRWLRPDNFDASGQQLTSLREQLPAGPGAASG